MLIKAVIDTNIFISALIKEGAIREIVTGFNYHFLLPEFAFEEIEEHKLEITKKSKLSEREFNILFLRLLRYIRVIPADIIFPYREETSEIMEKLIEKMFNLSQQLLLSIVRFGQMISISNNKK